MWRGALTHVATTCHLLRPLTRRPLPPPLSSALPPMGTTPTHPTTPHVRWLCSPPNATNQKRLYHPPSSNSDAPRTPSHHPASSSTTKLNFRTHKKPSIENGESNNTGKGGPKDIVSLVQAKQAVREMVRTHTAPYMTTMRQLFHVCSENGKPRVFAQLAAQIFAYTGRYPDEGVFIQMERADPGSIVHMIDVILENRDKLPNNRFEKLDQMLITVANLCGGAQGSDGSARLLLDVYGSVRSHGHIPAPAAYTAAVAFLGKSGDAETLETMIGYLEADHNHWSKIMYNAVIGAYAALPDVPNMEGVFAKMCAAGVGGPDHVTYTSLMAGFARGGMREKVDAIFDRMRAEGMRVDTKAATAAMMGAVSTNQSSSPVPMEQHESSTDNPGDGETTGRTSRTEESTGWDAKAYTTAIHRAARMGDLNGVTRLVDGMATNGIAPTVATYTAIVQGFARSKRGAGKPMIRGICEHMVERGVGLDVWFCTVAATEAGRNGDTETVDWLMHQIRLLKLVPDRLLFKAVMQAYGKAGEWEKAGSIVIEMQERGGLPLQYHDYDSLIRIAADRGDLSVVFNWLNVMQSSGLRPTSRTISRVVKGMGVCGAVEPMVAVLNWMRANQMPVLCDGRVLGNCVVFCLHKGDFRLAAAVIDQIAGLQLATDQAMAVAVLDAYAAVLQSNMVEVGTESE